MSSEDILSLQYMIFIVGGLGVAMFVYAGMLWRKANNQRTALKKVNYQTHVFDYLGIGTLCIGLGLVATVVLLAGYSTGGFVLEVLLAILTVLVFLWFRLKRKRAKQEYGQTVMFEYRASQLDDDKD